MGEEGRRKEARKEIDWAGEEEEEGQEEREKEEREKEE